MTQIILGVFILGKTSVPDVRKAFLRLNHPHR